MTGGWFIIVETTLQHIYIYVYYIILYYIISYYIILLSMSTSVKMIYHLGYGYSVMYYSIVVTNGIPWELKSMFVITITMTKQYFFWETPHPSKVYFTVFYNICFGFLVCTVLLLCVSGTRSRKIDGPAKKSKYPPISASKCNRWSSTYRWLSSYKVVPPTSKLVYNSVQLLLFAHHKPKRDWSHVHQLSHNYGIAQSWQTAVLQAHPEWGGSRVGEDGGCSRSPGAPHHPQVIPSGGSCWHFPQYNI